VAQDRRGRRRS